MSWFCPAARSFGHLPQEIKPPCTAATESGSMKVPEAPREEVHGSALVWMGLAPCQSGFWMSIYGPSGLRKCDWIRAVKT